MISLNNFLRHLLYPVQVRFHPHQCRVSQLRLITIESKLTTRFQCKVQTQAPFLMTCWNPQSLPQRL